MTEHHITTGEQLPLEPTGTVILELSRLISELCDGQMSDESWHRLQELLADRPEARQYYLRFMSIHSALAITAGCPIGTSAVDAQLAIERLTLERFAGLTLPPVVCAPSPGESFGRRRWRATVRWIASLSAVLLVAAATWWWTWVLAASSTGLTSQDTVVAVDASGQQLVAEVSFVSSAAVWQNPNASLSLAATIRAGQELVLERGQLELTYSSGAKLLLTGPSDFLVQPKGGNLRRGELVARVPQAGHGFTIETPHGKVIDLGTEFGVVVDDFGVSQVSVFEGKVETLPSSIAGRIQDKIELTSGRAIQWTDSSVTPIDVQGRRYLHPEDDLPASRFDPTTKLLLDEDFHGQRLSGSRWRTLGDVEISGRGLHLDSSPHSAQRPYLVTAHEIDPSRGPIHVTCDVRFEESQDAEFASLSILTRSSSERSKSGSPWQDMLARAVRCRFKTDLLSGEAMLEAGTKYEADREPSSITWSGFSRPQPDTLYRLDMRDDGLNVRFTVSLVENPSVRKTITCRSLFRGNQNFIALEGSSAGNAVVERVVISQEDAPLRSDRHLDSLSAGDSASESAADVDVAAELNTLAPAEGTLVLKDDFRRRTLDQSKWMTLGDVVWKDGQVQLGLPNEERHIDTWRARPYLITRQHLDPAQGAITVIGKVTFAENYLNGYGGSFAVMTRADRLLGGGPTWENSILRRGVRCNFWPAAYGLDHSLEIHEKPTPNTISLLTAKGYSIEPSSRGYLFKIVDDGHSASLVFQDAMNPMLMETASHSTSSLMNFGGHIGFESCWGSPVLLDNVRIYQAPLPRQDEQQ